MKFASALAASLLAASAGASEYTCLIEAYETVDVRSPVEALIDTITVRRGDLVKKGQVLVRLESAAERAGLDLARARATMQGELKVDSAPGVGTTARIRLGAIDAIVDTRVGV